MGIPLVVCREYTCLHSPLEIMLKASYLKKQMLAFSIFSIDNIKYNRYNINELKFYYLQTRADTSDKRL